MRDVVLMIWTWTVELDLGIYNGGELLAAGDILNIEI